MTASTTEKQCPFGSNIKKLAPFAWLPLRLVIMAVFVYHGAQKFGYFGSGMTIQQFAGFLGPMGFPMPLVFAYLAALSELIGGILVGIGFQTRIASLMIAGTMAVAVFGVHLQHGFSAPQGMGYEYPLTLLCAAIGLMLHGPGCASVDSWLKSHNTAEGDQCATPSHGAGCC